MQLISAHRLRFVSPVYGAKFGEHTRWVAESLNDSLSRIHYNTSCWPPAPALHEISGLLNTGLDRNSLSILVQLCEMGVNPGALVHVVQELSKFRSAVDI